MAGTASNLDLGISNLGSGVSSIFTGLGNQASAASDLVAANAETQAAGFATQNLEYAKQSQAIQQMQMDRSIFKTISGMKATIAGNGFAESGSAVDLLADSARQGELSKHVLGLQGDIEQTGYKAQIAADQAKAQQDQMAADAAGTAGIGNFVGSAVKSAGAIAQFAMFL